jgi:integrase
MKKTTFNNCYRSEISVTPANWHTAKASIKKGWRVHYRFYDPVFRDDPKRWAWQVTIKGMNIYHTVEERQNATRDLLQHEKNLTDVKGYNHVTGVYMAPEASADQLQQKLSPQTPFIRALELAVPKCEATPKTRGGITNVVKFFGQSAAMLNLDQSPLKDIRRGDIIEILDNCRKLTKLVKGKTVPKIWNDNQYNYFRKYLHIVFGVLDRLEVLEYNPITKIPVRQIVKEESGRRILDAEQRRQVVAELRRHPAFFRFVNIFYPSGGRIAEFCRIQGKHVDLAGQRFRVLIKKRKKKEWVWKTITDTALPFWQEAAAGCGIEDYVFSKRLQPGPKSVNPDLITKRWKRLVKNKLGIDVDLYSLKHLYLSEIMDSVIAEENARQEALKVAAGVASHTSGEMMDQVYDVRKKDREHAAAKGRGRAL